MAKKLAAENLEFMSINEVAAKLSIHPKTVAKLVRGGVLNSIKLGKRRLVSMKHFRQFLESNITEGSLD